ncbi:MAG: phospholipid carrier-dependent glycosyltransferase [Isosphaeraceae bacterium]|nr:phospholipid carrier-dependent glycosyltransferase [Isosphaeraceae bacterium]
MAAIVVLSALAREAALARGAGTLEDPDNYLPLARSLARGQGFVFNGRPTAYRPPLYPLVLAPLVLASGPHLVWGIAGLHVLLGAGTVLLTAATARRWGLSRRRAWIAAAIVACDPVLVAQSRAVMTETLGAFLVAFTLWALTHRGARGVLLGGLGFGLSALCRPSLLPGAALVALAYVLAARDPDDVLLSPRTRRLCPAGGEGERKALRTATRRCLHALLLLAATAATLAPWAFRNARLFGEPVWTTTHGGYTLLLANNPIYYDEVLHGPPGAVWTGPSQYRFNDAVNAAAAGRPEPEADRRLRATALRMLKERPGDFACASLARLGRFWGVAPAGAVYSRPLRLASALWTVPLWVALGVGSSRKEVWRWPRVSAPAVIIALTSVHVVYWTDLRMRAPVVPAIALVAATAVRPLQIGREKPLKDGQEGAGKKS